MDAKQDSLKPKSIQYAFRTVKDSENIKSIECALGIRPRGGTTQLLP